MKKTKDIINLLSKQLKQLNRISSNEVPINNTINTLKIELRQTIRWIEDYYKEY